VFGPRTKYSEPMGKYPSIFQAKILALERFAQFSSDNGYCKQDIAIMTDSQYSAITNSSKMVWECLGKLNELGRNNKVSLLWVPGYRGIEGNEKINILAPFTGPEPFCGLGDVNCKHELKLGTRKSQVLGTTHWTDALYETFWRLQPRKM